MSKLTDSEHRILLDVTRMVWRAWRGRHPTGIDRVCLAYVEHFRQRALAVVQRKGLFLVLSERRSKLLFDLLLRGRAVPRIELVQMLAAAAISARRNPPRPNMIYLNVGHTGLNDRAIANWIERNRLRAIYLLHDLIPITDPEFCRPEEADKHQERMSNALETATGVIGNSQVTLDQLSEFAVVNSIVMPAQVVAWIGASETRSPIPGKTPETPYFVVVGTIEARKNHLMLLHIWKRMVAADKGDVPLLVIVGQPGWEADEALGILSDLKELRGRVLHLEDCGDDELAGWIAGAKALLMPSFAEGFGLPVVEALSLGTPVIASDLAVYHEIVGDIPTYLPPDDETTWEAAIASFATGSPERERQLLRIVDYRPPTWAKHFETVEGWLAGF